MSTQRSRLDNKVQNYIDELFAGVGASQELFDLKEELATNIKEKIADYQARGMEEDEAFKEAVISMGDLSGLVDDMRKHGQDVAKKSVYSSMANRISNAGIIAGVILILFGILNSAMIYFMGLPGVAVSGSGIFIVVGGFFLTNSLLARETRKKYAMNKVRAGLYALSVGLILFSLFVAASSGFATGEMFIAISSLMIFFIAGVGLLLGLILSGNDRRKPE
mgnify:CR=1 FL=1